MQSNIRRSALVDMAKGFGIVLVVYGHCLRGLEAAGVVPQKSLLMITDYVIYTFHMPLFFIASGLFVAKTLEKSNFEFLIVRLKTLLYPYFFWSLLFGFIQIILSGSSATNKGMDVSRLSEIGWNPISPFWFLYALFFCYVITWSLKYLAVEIRIILLILSFIITFYTIGGVRNDIAYGLTYFTIGILISKRQWLKLIPSGYGATVGFIGAFLAVALASYYLDVPERLPFAAALMGVVATAVACHTIEKKAPQSHTVKLLIILGQYSLGIYVMHIIVLGFVRTLLLRFFQVTDIAILMIPAILAALTLPVLVQYLLVRFGVNAWFGLPFSASNRNLPIHPGSTIN